MLCVMFHGQNGPSHYSATCTDSPRKLRHLQVAISGCLNERRGTFVQGLVHAGLDGKELADNLYGVKLARTGGGCGSCNAWLLQRCEKYLLSQQAEVIGGKSLLQTRV